MKELKHKLEMARHRLIAIDEIINYLRDDVDCLVDLIDDLDEEIRTKKLEKI